MIPSILTDSRMVKAIPEFLSASYMAGSSSISRSFSGRSSASSTQSTTRRYSMLQFPGTTKPTQIQAPVCAGTDTSIEPIKPSPPSRRSRILRFFGLHREPFMCVSILCLCGLGSRCVAHLSDTNDFLAPGITLEANDRMILDRLDLKVLIKSPE